MERLFTDAARGKVFPGFDGNVLKGGLVDGEPNEACTGEGGRVVRWKGSRW